MASPRLSSGLRISWGVFLSGCAIWIPYPYNFLPDLGKILSPISLSLLSFLFPSEALSLASDERGMYLFVIVWGIFSIMAGGVSLVFASTSRIIHATSPYFSKIVAYYLSLQLFRYGWDKVFKHQFYLPEPNTLFTPLGYLDRDILYWSTMGTSYFYSVALGMIEVLVAGMLLFRKARILGGYLSCGIMLQVLIVNIGFHITVKGFSFFLLLLSLNVIYPSLRSVYCFFIQGGASTLPQEAEFSWEKKHPIHYVLLKYATIATIFIETLFPFFYMSNFHDDHSPRPPYHGAYRVQNFSINDEWLTCENEKKWARIFFHRQSYFIIQSPNGDMQDYKCEVDTVSRILTLRNNQQKIIGTLHLLSPNTHKHLKLSGKMNGDTLVLSAEKIQLDSLPLFLHIP